MCATKTCSSAIEIQSTLVQRSQPTFVTRLMLIVDAFREARAMQRAARSRLFFEE